MNFRSIAQKMSANKIVVGFVAVLAIAIIGTTSVASAAPDYFAVVKPSSSSQCQGKTTAYHWEWHWVYRYHHRVFGYWERVQYKQANWKKLGFESKDQCIAYTSTAKPTDKKQCDKRGWENFGFSDKQDCYRYVKLHGGNGSGYGGKL
jgi:hypothetical protein